MVMMLGGLLVAGPAFADFKAAVSAYNKGNYEQAYRQFKSLASSGDARAHRYLDALRSEGFGSSAAPDDSGGSIWSGTPSRSGGSSGASSLSGNPWSWIQSSAERGSAKRAASGGVVMPDHESVLASLYFLPADATMIGMQYVAKAIRARELELDLRHASRVGAGAVMAIFALFWWFVIVKLTFAIGGFLVRVVRGFTRPLGEEV
ncbi:MAG: hypothetical protein AAF495_21530 [Pseudomonadota bacterium]